jgi:diguanylate cyclase (GGDEF)-like protein
MDPNVTTILAQLPAHCRTWVRRYILHPLFLFGGLLAILCWVAAVTKIGDEKLVAEKDVIADVTSFSLLLQQDVLRTVSDLDRIIKFLRRSNERAEYNGDWRALVQEDFTAHGHTVQIAIIDSRGMMVTSTANPSPKSPVDLSDREHFKVHRDSTSDALHISKPLMGRASGKWSVQVTRRFVQKDGRFGGVIVVSLDPAKFLSTYSRLDAVHDSGFAVIGDDDIVRAGAGLFADAMGRDLAEREDYQHVQGHRDELEISSQRVKGARRLVGIRNVPSTTLTVLVSVPHPHATTTFGFHVYHAYAAVLSTAIFGFTFGSIRRQRGHVKQIERLAHNDTLTKLPNRLSFQHAIEFAYDTCTGTPSFMLHMIDLDHFKAVNDTFGHPMGDALLCAVAKRLKASVRETDLVFRLGGDEFALIQTDCVDSTQADAVAKRLCQVLAEPFDIQGERLHIGCSIGIAAPSADLRDAKQLLQAADTALYRSKAAGRGRHAFYDRQLTLAMQKRQQLEHDLREAVENNQLEIHYQPKVTLSLPQQTLGYEALVRWRHPKLGMIPPLDFIGIAEETGLIVPMGARILEQVCSVFAARPTSETIAVNASAIQFSRGSVIEAVMQALSRSGLAPHRLEIEITESAVMSDDKRIVPQLEQLRKMGVRISLDDFGTGYSSLSYLDKYPIDCIKIDRSFVAKLGNEPRTAAVTRAIVCLASDLDMTVVAEGVETKAQAEFLQALGCQVAQGYFFGRPKPASELWPVADDSVQAA